MCSRHGKLRRSNPAESMMEVTEDDVQAVDDTLSLVSKLIEYAESNDSDALNTAALRRMEAGLEGLHGATAMIHAAQRKDD